MFRACLLRLGALAYLPAWFDTGVPTFKKNTQPQNPSGCLLSTIFGVVLIKMRTPRKVLISAWAISSSPTINPPTARPPFKSKPPNLRLPALYDLRRGALAHRSARRRHRCPHRRRVREQVHLGRRHHARRLGSQFRHSLKH